MDSSCPHLTNAHLTKDLQGKLIYKDECTRCFDSSKSPTGVDVCLKCFNGSCCNAEFNHSMLHYNQTNHSIVLNVRKVLKVQDKKEPAQITKLAIGKEGGIDGEGDEYETIVKLKCLACVKDLDRTNPAVAGLVDSVLLCQSAYFSQTLQEWELKLEQCEHTLTLDQSGANKIASKSLAHCGDCDLYANLWLCMTCGHLGCGRKNWDGTGGNNHAVNHSDSTHHPLVCKLGTITPEGTASIYCYACNDDKNDEQLAQHLSNLGIDIAQQKKTEKTVQEMDLELNLSLTLSKIIEDGKQLIPLFGPGLTGLENLGNSCYMNSVIQTMFLQPEFQSRYDSEAQVHLLTCSKFSPDCLMCQVSKLCDGIFSGRYSDKKEAKKVVFEGQSEEERKKIEYVQDGVKPHMFKTLVGRDHQEFKTNLQQDAQEYFIHLLEKLQRMEKQQGVHSYPGEIFDFELETRVECTECHGVKYTLSKGQQLTVTAPVDSSVEKGTPVDLEACLQRFFSEEQIPDFQCGQCSKRTICLKRQRINTFPKVLLVVLQRFVYDNWVPKKLEIELQVPLKEPIDLERFKGNQGQAQTGEQLIAEQAAAEEFGEPDLNGNLLNQIIQMGVPELAAKHALHLTGNNSADMAVMWYFENMDNPVLSTPLMIKKGNPAVASKQGPQVDEETVQSLVAMFGFPERKVRKALRSTENNPERAADWLFSHSDDPDSDDQEMSQPGADVAGASEYACAKPGMYDLTSFITHLGSSVHAGHYVCHVRQADETWVYFNDAKVAQTMEPPIGKGYMYFLRKRQ